MNRFVRKTEKKAESCSIESIGRFLCSVRSALDMNLPVKYVGIISGWCCCYHPCCSRIRDVPISVAALACMLLILYHQHRRDNYLLSVGHHPQLVLCKFPVLLLSLGFLQLCLVQKRRLLLESLKGQIQ